jgi:uncharacterized membrane protein
MTALGARSQAGAAMESGRSGLGAVAAWGAVAGARTFSAPALLSIAWAGRRRPLARTTAERALTWRAAPWVFGALAAFELAADQWPGLQARIAPPSLLGRVLSAALVGSALGRGRDSRRDTAIAAGSAVISAFASYGLRRAANRRLPNSVSGLLEDALVLGAGGALAASTRRSARPPWRR